MYPKHTYLIQNHRKLILNLKLHAVSASAGILRVIAEAVFEFRWQRAINPHAGARIALPQSSKVWKQHEWNRKLHRQTTTRPWPNPGPCLESFDDSKNSRRLESTNSFKPQDPLKALLLLSPRYPKRLKQSDTFKPLIRLVRRPVKHWNAVLP